ncbi:hypothetical protein UO65_4150 [Actinokineospora spheciospongiae]|uniref:Uncharacterized protein n=1 Tax=Actinokineospora spheciospongiae TaxID=909613 RepID=W7IJI4_9PSEU|nr:hypothetical protein UO65_4150 [Actinokineospora spheciospongiae]
MVRRNSPQHCLRSPPSRVSPGGRHIVPDPLALCGASLLSVKGNRKPVDPSDDLSTGRSTPPLPCHPRR